MLARKISSEIDISQATIKKQLRLFLTLKQRDPELISRLKEGYCVGFTAFASQALWLSLNASEEGDCKVNWSSLLSQFQKIARWDGQDSLSSDLEQDIDSILGQLEWLQKSKVYNFTSQANVFKELTTDSGNLFTKEYSLAGIFSADSFLTPIAYKSKQIILLEEICKENRLVFVAGPEHFSSVLRFNGYYYFYNPNAKMGWQVFPEEHPNQLIAALFEAHYFYLDEPVPLGFICLRGVRSFSSSYISQKKLLAMLEPLQLIYKTNRFEHSNLCMAASIGCRESVGYFLEQFPDEVNKPCPSSGTPLFLAVREGFTDIVKTLLLAGANPNITLQGRYSPLHYALIFHREQSVKLLLSAGARPNVYNEFYFTPLSVAVETYQFSMIKLLVAKGARVNQSFASNNKVLHLAVILGDVKLVQFFLEHGAKTHHLNDEGISPLYLALERGHREIVEIFLRSKNTLVRANEYQLFIALAEESKDEWFESWLGKVQALYLCEVINEELYKVRRSAPAYFELARAELFRARQKQLSVDGVMAKMVPVLKEVPREGRWFGLWGGVDLVGAVMRVRKEFVVSRNFSISRT